MPRNNTGRRPQARPEATPLPQLPATKAEAAVKALGRSLSHSEREWLTYWSLSARNFWLIDGRVHDLQETNKQYTVRAVVYRMRLTGQAPSSVRRRRSNREVDPEGQEHWKYKIHLPADGPGEVGEGTYPDYCRALFAVKDALLAAELAFTSANSRQVGEQIRSRLREQRAVPMSDIVPNTPSATPQRARGLDIS
jgi:hypothetical protein